ncbi:hypothetical protein AnaeK_2252 [Anaeromyxobacter sp. K]|uniref:Uncharacterized protein n=1 Tax=Anaeromyxobacter dehalogenans (strain ATCC BAA-258 / DSM 21875 / 2CP-1) TaxID=455488 RepID=B8JAF9_ANAD2|nr:hypothetical protein [Anaeromyxobacter sp. K]ACG73479.1 hypothetical protein AnaeK_2252 [Anaeromyxobacter sp. K]ACL65678.1 conserved hypothetical protein [Anaeromyxobacter dehalogenans 2CP-1]
MSVSVAIWPSFVTVVSSLIRSFLSEFASVSSLVSLSNFWTVPVSWWVRIVLPVLDADEPVPMSLEDPVP